MKCHGQGCKNPVAWECKKLWGKGGTFFACAEHKPGGKPGENPAVRELVAKRPFYACTPVGK